jgi:hypothetical protein
MKSKTYEDPENDLHRIRYIIESGLGILYEERYCQKIDVQIMETDESGNPKTIVGSISAYKLLFDLAINKDLNLLNIADYQGEALVVAEQLYHSDRLDLKEPVEEHFNDSLGEISSPILSKIEILPAYRGRGIGPKAIKDIYNNFIQGCGLFALKVFPLLFEHESAIRSNYLRAAMNYSAFE